MSINEALLFVALHLSIQIEETSPQMIFYRSRGEIALVQIHTSLRILVEHKLADVRYGDNRFYKLNKTGKERLNALKNGEIDQLLNKPPKRKK